MGQFSSNRKRGGGGTGGGLSSADVTAIAATTIGAATGGQTVGVGQVVFASDTKMRFTNETAAPISISGTTHAALLADQLTVEAANTAAERDIYTKTVTANTTAAANDRIFMVNPNLATVSATATDIYFDVGRSEFAAEVRVVPPAGKTIGGEPDYVVISMQGVVSFGPDPADPDNIQILANAPLSEVADSATGYAYYEIASTDPQPTAPSVGNIMRHTDTGNVFIYSNESGGSWVDIN